MTIKEDYLKILEGCKKGLLKCGTKNQIGDINLCPSCQAKKEVFLERCKDELEFLKSMGDTKLGIRISQLKEVLEKS